MNRHGIPDFAPTPKELAALVDGIIALGHDPEVAHGAEDDLHLQIIETFSPAWVQAEVQRLSDAEFPRWRA